MKSGDEVTVLDGYMRPYRIGRVERITATTIRAFGESWSKDGMQRGGYSISRRRIVLTTDEHRAYLARKTMLSRVVNMHPSGWERLSTERLAQVLAWVDEKEVPPTP